MISIITVNYNKKEFLRDCLDSVVKQDYEGIEIIVVDNASTDGSRELVGKSYPGVKLITNPVNEFFCAACNRGIESSLGEYILCVNNDVRLGSDYLSAALSKVNIDKRIGMISGKILRDDCSTIDSTGLFPGRNRKPIERGYGEKDTGQLDKEGYVFGVSGACAFFKRELLEDVKDDNGYFDKSFGMYYEDLDICWRAQKKGWKAYYTPGAVAYHKRGGTLLSDRKKNRRVFHCIPAAYKKMCVRNRYRCMFKNDTPLGILKHFPFIAAYEIKLWSYLLVFFLTEKIKDSIILCNGGERSDSRKRQKTRTHK